jgi:hypothetical protein
MPFISKTPRPPYYAVIFSSINADVDHTEHTAMYKRMVEVAQRYEGYLGIEPARNPDGTGVAAVYWKDHDSIRPLHATPSTGSPSRRAGRSGTATTSFASARSNATTGDPMNDPQRLHAGINSRE